MVRTSRLLLALLVSVVTLTTAPLTVAAGAAATQDTTSDGTQEPARFVTIKTAWAQSENLRLDIDQAASELNVAPADLPPDTMDAVIADWKSWQDYCCSTYDVTATATATKVVVTFAARDNTKPATSPIRLATTVGGSSTVPTPKPVRQALAAGTSLAKAIDAYAKKQKVAPRDLTEAQLTDVGTRWQANRPKCTFSVDTFYGMVTAYVEWRDGDRANASVFLGAERGWPSTVKV